MELVTIGTLYKPENFVLWVGMWYQDSGTDHIGWQKQYGFSVRCLKD
ncbi:MAG: hypothetical protein WCI31_03635 [Prolixibacteraceae bacterium]